MTPTALKVTEPGIFSVNVPINPAGVIHVGAAIVL
jgi:hypothetical protein